MLNLNIFVLLPLILSVIVVLITLFLWYLRRNDDYWKKRGVPFYPRPSILEIIHLIAAKPVSEIMVENYKKYGRLYGAFQFSKPVLSIAEPELLKDIFVKDFHIFNYRRDMSFKDPLLDNMVSVLTGEDWKRVRTVITPAFTSRQMRKMGDIINSCSMTVLKTFDKYFNRGEPIDCKEVFGAFITDVIALSAFATRVDTLNDPDHPFVRRIVTTFREPPLLRTILLSLIPQRILIYLRIEALQLMDFFKDVVLQVIKERRHSGQKYDDLLQTLMDAVDNRSADDKNDEDEEDRYGRVSTNVPTNKGKWLTEDELIAQCVMFFFVGYETTASTLAFMAYALATNPQWQEKLTEEVDTAFKTHKTMSHDAVREMKILDAVVSETLRMYPVILATERTAAEKYRLSDTRIVVEKGMSVGVPIYAMHYDPDFFPEPHIFNPERFLEPTHPQYSYLPFGAGPRNCLGMRFALLQIKMCMANILSQYKFKVASTIKIPLQYKKLSTFLSVKELPLILEKRHL